jgi:hypothetical protein
MVNPAENGAISPDGLPPLQRLLLAYAPAQARAWHALCWTLDQRLAGIVRRGGEPTITAIRLAWWDAVLVEDDRAKGGGEPLVEQWRALAPDAAKGAVARLIDGWRVLASPEALSDDDLLAYGKARGGGLFALLAANAVEADQRAVEAAGHHWALWDLAAHVQDTTLAARALGSARSMLSDDAGRVRGADVKPLRLARAIVEPDIRAGRVPGGGFSVRHYGRLLIASLKG